MGLFKWGKKKHVEAAPVVPEKIKVWKRFGWYYDLAGNKVGRVYDYGTVFKAATMNGSMLDLSSTMWGVTRKGAEECLLKTLNAELVTPSEAKRLRLEMGI